ncbi:hypothetical protein HPB50_011407 [Hyalomma asiaticum]|uniref:Uncharacterized protein n=1 Tax=Hyalomma asiaticum TaxID=266040 RepID=A0ACB7T177_HYAAI|nr:hypothetical protein HPB50_011407 [Hyalomma asiaticum]
MEGTQHVLTGFGDFLERRQVSFVDPLPCSCVCCACGIASSSTVRLPCRHELCRPCHGQSANVCPVDSVKFEEDHVVQQTTDLQQLRVFCINGDCDFVGKLAELSGHVLHCTKDELKCRKCGDHVKRNAAVVHRRQCFVDVGTTSSSPDLAAVVADTETSRGQASPEGHVDQHVGDSSNHVTQDVVVAEASVGAKRTYAGELKRVLPSASYSEETVLRETISGPCRAASEPGVFVTLCKFDNIYEKYAELRRRRRLRCSSRAAWLPATRSL